MGRISLFLAYAALAIGAAGIALAVVTGPRGLAPATADPTIVLMMVLSPILSAFLSFVGLAISLLGLSTEIGGRAPAIRGIKMNILAVFVAASFSFLLKYIVVGV